MIFNPEAVQASAQLPLFLTCQMARGQIYAHERDLANISAEETHCTYSTTFSPR